MRVAIRPIVERSPRRAAGRSAGPLGQRHRDRPRLAVAHGRDLHLVAGTLLAELMRIKGEGDYNAIKTLVDKYAVHFDPALRDQVVSRYKQLDLPTYWAGINTVLTAQLDAKDSVTAGIWLRFSFRIWNTCVMNGTSPASVTIRI